MRRVYLFLCLMIAAVTMALANPVDDLLNRIDEGAAAKFKTELVNSDKDYF